MASNKFQLAFTMRAICKSTSFYKKAPIVNSSGGFHTSAIRADEDRYDHIIHIRDDEEFMAKVIKNKAPILIDFHARWCGPCKVLGPRLESVIAAKKGKVKLVKVDIDTHSELAINHGIEAVPTVIAMKNGKQVDMFVGLKDAVHIKRLVDRLAA